MNIEYRLSGEATFPAQIHDCKAAIRWIRANAEKYNINPDSIGVWGVSAGGHLAALLGTSGDVQELEGEGGSEGFSSSVQAVVDWFGPSDLSRFGSWMRVQSLLGGLPTKKTKLAKMANPITYVMEKCPPFLMVHGQKDTLIPYTQSELLYRALKNANVEAVLIKVKNAEHGFRPNPRKVTIEPNIQKIVQMTMDFFDQHLRS